MMKQIETADGFYVDVRNLCGTEPTGPTQQHIHPHGAESMGTGPLVMALAYGPP